MADVRTKLCDNLSVGVVICDKRGRIALLERARTPVGIAPPAGHVDNHGSPRQAAVDEVKEELGLKVDITHLQPTTIQNRRVDNPCRRPGGDHHNWWIYSTDRYEGELRPDPEEAKGASWFDRAQLQTLVERTYSFQTGLIPAHDYQANPGLEPVWIDFLVELGYCSTADRP